MTAENLTAVESAATTISTVIRYATKTTKTTEFFDPAWQLAISIEYYFQYALIAIGIFGIVANALVLYALIEYHARETKKRQVNLLMINQNLLDITACFLLIITFSMRVSNIYLTGTLGYFLCTILVSENATNCIMHASIVNLTPTSRKSSDLI